MRFIPPLILRTAFLLLLAVGHSPAQGPLHESRTDRDGRMKWWREARFGMFIHWGLYSIPAGEWKGETGHGEWIRTTGQIPLGEYDKFTGLFNPAKFDARAWVRTAKEAGMKYITITTKHHDGFCLFDSKFTEFDVMSTPFRRDIMKELADACHAEGMKMCWYHSIMDWHHPDYLPRREWEHDRPAEGANFRRYVDHLKSQLKELLTKYGEIGVLWFDGEWESTWNNTYGKELYDYVRSIRPDIIVNNRVGVGRQGLSGFAQGETVGDFGTPEQEIPPTGIPDVDWETCMTMNDHWGYNKHDLNFKSTKELLRTLADIASKGGNFLLNVGPTAEGLIPKESLDRLRQIGDWMRANGEAIYATGASPFRSLSWGRCTVRPQAGGARLFLHVFDWPSDGRLVVPGIFNTAQRSYILGDASKRPLVVSREMDALVISVPGNAPDTNNAVIVLDVSGKPDVSAPPQIAAEFPMFVDSLEVAVSTDRDDVELRYTTDGSVPTITSAKVTGKIKLGTTTVLSARGFRGGTEVSETAVRTFRKVSPRSAVSPGRTEPGIMYQYYEGDWDRLPRFDSLESVSNGTLINIDFSPRRREEHFGFRYEGLVKVERTGVYSFAIDSDDGSRLYIGDTLLVDNDGLHGMIEQEGVIALAQGLHPIRIEYFERTGGDDLKVSLRFQGNPKERIQPSRLFH